MSTANPAETCPKYPSCSAPICPLDPRWPEAVHLTNERVCFYLTVSGKVGAAERFAGDETFAACVAALPLVAAKHRSIARRVEQAARTGFREGNPSWKASGDDNDLSKPATGGQDAA